MPFFFFPCSKEKMGRKIQSKKETKAKAFVRPKKNLSQKCEGITKPTLAKLARRGGMERVPKVAQDYLKLQHEYVMYLLVRSSIIIASSKNLRKITVEDVALASRLALGRELVGFRNNERSSCKTKKK